MSRASGFALFQQEKRDLAVLLSQLTPREWETESLCEGWRVRDVVAHLLYDATLLSKYTYEIIRAHGSADKLNKVYVDRSRGWSTDKLLDVFRSTIDRSHLGKLQPKLALADLLIHHQDIRRPLNRPRTVPEETLRTVLDNPDPFIRSSRRLRGLRWIATDIDWSYGSGPEIEGPGEAIVMAVAGRPSALADLSGEGMYTLHARVRHS